MSPVKSARLHNTKKPENKKPFDFEVDEMIPAVPVADKLDDDGVPVEGAVTEEEGAEDEVGLDDEELNPFGDKWEE